ncbi:hypothetical protein PhCBS80983_g05105 [Powellomyces hirtus]|uniref:N-acetyltransferase domain-containing protein n=1 Tax=Powellomyces hirtus TaxID=109895 RepID=A0A507DW27_9FUNG|nr:hypothetical protein PhCBS80983_g05105 [Powellomyces hirtus]
MSTPQPPYKIRSLHGSEVEAFLDHLSTVFGAVGAPRGLFSDHWYNNPHKSLDGVIVAVAGEDEQIVSSMQVYRRELKLQHGRYISIGAIGDVATHPAHRGKGLASHVMTRAETYMLANHLSLAVLHAAPLAVPLYEKLGYRILPMKMSVLHLPAQDPQDPPGWIRWSGAVDFENTDHVDVMTVLHQRLAPPGTFRRTAAYWNQWVRPKSNDTRWKIVKLLAQGQVNGRPAAAYLFLGFPLHEAKVTVFEFFCGFTSPNGIEEPFPPQHQESVLRHLIKSAFDLAATELKTQDVEVSIASSLLPTPCDIPSHVEVDKSWLFKWLGNCSAEGKDGQKTQIGVVEDLFHEIGPEYSFCKTDAF